MDFISVLIFVMLNLSHLENREIFERYSSIDQANSSSNCFITYPVLPEEEDEDIVPPRLLVWSQPETEEDDDIVPPRMWVLS